MNERQQDIEAIVRGWNDRQPGESDEDVAGRIVDDLARTNTERLEDDRADAELWRAAIRRGARDLAHPTSSPEDKE